MLRSGRCPDLPVGVGIARRRREREIQKKGKSGKNALKKACGTRAGKHAAQGPNESYPSLEVFECGLSL